MSPATALAFARDPVTTIHSELLGTLRVEDDALIRFPVGLFGFPDCSHFVLLPAEREGLHWLQSAEHSALVFLLADPFLFFADYAVDLGAVERAELQIQDASDVAILAIVTLPRTRAEKPTANLQGPLAFNLRQRLAKQLAISEREWGMRRPFEFAAPRGE